jgi:hypothetical protein
LRFLPAAVRRLLAQAVSSSPSSVPLQSAALPDPPRPQPCGFTAKHLPWGSSPSSRRQPAASCDGLPKPTAFHPRRFSRPRWFAPPLALWVCFTPQPRPGFSLQGLCSPHPAEPPRRWTVPSRRWRRGAAVGCPPAPRPVAPPSGLCSGCGSVVRSAVVSRRSDPIPSWDFPPPGSLSRRRWGRLHVPSARGLQKESDPCEPTPSLTCSVSPTPSLACLSRGCRPARGFRPAVMH